MLYNGLQIKFAVAIDTGPTAAELALAAGRNYVAATPASKASSRYEQLQFDYDLKSLYLIVRVAR